MKEYKLDMQHQVPVFQIESSLVLLDSFAPFSGGDEPLLEIMGETHIALAQYQDLDMEKARALAKVPVNRVIGLDILKKYNVCLDYTNNVIRFDNSPFTYYADIGRDSDERVPVEVGNHLIIEVGINGKPFNMYLDTASQFSYLKPEIWSELMAEEGLNPKAAENRHHQICREVSITKLKKMDISFKPAFWAPKGHFTGSVKGILGGDFFNNYQFWFFLSHKEIEIMDAYKHNPDFDPGNELEDFYDF